MAKLHSSLSFTGTIDNLSAYTMRGVDGVVLRKKGGASKQKIKTHPSFVNTRRVNAEFGGRACASKFVMSALLPVKPLADFNIAGPIIGLLAPIQNLDMTSSWGQRNVVLSANPKLLDGFSLNRKNLFDSVVRNALTATVSRETHSAQLEIPALVPGINFFMPRSHAYFSIIFTLGVVPDLFYSENGYKPSHLDYEQLSVQRIATPWYGMQDTTPPATLQLSLPSSPPDQAYTLLATVGIRYGSPVGNEITQVKYAGSAKVCGVA